MQPDKSAPQPGGALEQFEILGKIAEGGMGAVYKARHTGLDKLVALKVLNTTWKDDTALLRFQNEAKTLSRLNHPFIAEVYDFGISKNGEPFMAIEFVDGITLQELVENKSRLPFEEAIPIWLEISTALCHAHNRGVVHRDIKPSNVMLTVGEDGERSVKVVDFGIAKSSADDTGNLTQTGGMIGSPLFMSPEQSLGEPVTPKSDMYSLGCLMFYSIVGKPPFEGDTILSTVLMHRENPTPKLQKLVRNIPERIVTLINTLLKKDKDERPQSMEFVIAELEGILEEVYEEPQKEATEVQHETISLKQMASNLSKEKTNKLPIVLMILVGIVLSIGIVVGITLNLQSKSNTEVIKTSAVGSHLMEEDDNIKIDPIKNVKVMLELGKADFILNADYQKEGWEWTDERLAVFGKGKKVAQNIDLTNNSLLTDAGLKHLSGQPLQTIKLNETAVEDLRYLPSCNETLRHIELERTPITDQALRKLEEYPNLTRLHLDDTSVSIDAVKRLLDKVAITDLRMGLKPMPPKAVFDELYERYPGCHVQPGKQGSKLDKDTRVSMRFMADGKVPEALEVWKKWESKLDKITDHRKRIASKVYEMEAICYMSMDKTKQAEQALRTAVALSDKYGSSRDRIQAYDRLFEFCAKTKKTQESIAVGRKLLALRKSDNKLMTLETVAVQNQLAEMLFLTGEYEEASKLIAETIDELKVSASVKALEEERARSENRWTPDVQALTEKHSEAWAAAYLSLGKCQLALQQNDLARANFSEAIKILQPLTQGSSRRCLLGAYSFMTQLCINTHKFEEALDYNTMVLELIQSLNMKRNIKLLYLSQRINILTGLGRIEEARKIEAQVAELNAMEETRSPQKESTKRSPKSNH